MSGSEETDTEEKEKFELKKNLGLWSAVGILCGTVIGSGIFVSPVGVLEHMNGSVGLSLVMWLACGLLSTLSALCYAELGCCIRESGADFAYNNVAIGPPMAFVYIWTMVLIVRGTAQAATSIVFANYLFKLVIADCEPPILATKLIAAWALCIATWINYRSVKISAKVQIIFSAAKFLVMSIISLVGLISLFRGNPVGLNNFRNAFDPDVIKQIHPSGIGLAFFQGLFSYNGFANVNLVTEELKNVPRNLPLSIKLSMFLVTLFYILTNIGYMSVLTPEEMLSSKSVAVTFGEKILGSFSWIIPLGVCISTAGALNGVMLASSRYPFVAARRGHMPEILGMIHLDYLTPAPALLTVAISSLSMLLLESFDSLLNAFGFSTWLFYGICALDLLILRWTRPKIERPYKVHITIPIIVLLASIYLVIAPLVQNRDIIFLIAAAFILSGFLVYYVFVYKKASLPGTKFVTRLLQKAMNVASTDWEDINW